MLIKVGGMCLLKLLIIILVFFGSISTCKKRQAFQFLQSMVSPW